MAGPLTQNRRLPGTIRLFAAFGYSLFIVILYLLWKRLGSVRGKGTVFSRFSSSGFSYAVCHDLLAASPTLQFAFFSDFTLSIVNHRQADARRCPYYRRLKFSWSNVNSQRKAEVSNDDVGSLPLRFLPDAFF